MNDAVRKPCQDIKHGILMRRQKFAQIGTIEHVLQCRQHSDPDRWTPFARDHASTPTQLRHLSKVDA